MAALQYLAGQRLTADALQRAVPDRVVQGSDQTVTSSITPTASEIVITVDGLLLIELEIRFGTGSAGGGFRWDWSDSGSVTFVSRAVGTSGSATSGSPTNIADMYWRAPTDFGTDVTSAQFTNLATQRGSEKLVVDGSGTLTFRFAQETSVAVATTLFANSHALITRLGS